jgi:tetratricopeptide (TPR) repeat protein
MSMDQFIKSIKDNVNSFQADSELLKMLVERYPWSPHLNMLHLQLLKNASSIEFTQHLAKVSFSVPDRSVLWAFLYPEKIVKGRNHGQFMANLSDQQVDEMVSVHNSISDVEKPEDVPSAEQRSENELKEIIQQRLGEIQGDEGNDRSGGDVEFSTESKRERLKLIDRFIEEEPTIKVDKDYINPIDYAERSTEENYDLATETLASVLESQGKIKKAIEVYKQLILKFPEKSSYFAARIESLEKKD